MQTYHTKNLTITESRDTIHIKIRKKYELALLAFFAFAFVFFFVVLFVLLPIARENQESESNTLLIVEVLFYFVGSIMLVGAALEVLKREWVIVDSPFLMLGSNIFGFRFSEKRYLLKEIVGLELANPPVRGWRKLEIYEDAWQKKVDYSNDLRKVYPTIHFQHNGDEIYFASGLSPDEAKMVIEIISKMYKP